MTIEDVKATPRLAERSSITTEPGFGNKAFGTMLDDGSLTRKTIGDENDTTLLLSQTQNNNNNNNNSSRDRSHQVVITFSASLDDAIWLDSFASRNGVSRSCAVRKILGSARQVSLRPDLDTLPEIAVFLTDNGKPTNGIKQEIALEDFKRLKERVNRFTSHKDSADSSYIKDTVDKYWGELRQLLPKLGNIDPEMDIRINELYQILRKMRRGTQVE